MAIQTLKELKRARARGDDATYMALRQKFDDPQWVEDYYRHFGYGYYKGHDLKELIPNVKLSFYSFHIMVILGCDQGHADPNIVIMTWICGFDSWNSFQTP